MRAAFTNSFKEFNQKAVEDCFKNAFEALLYAFDPFDK